MTNWTELKNKEDWSVIGKSTPRIDVREKVIGQARYAGDIIMPNMLYGKILHSPIAHGRVVHIDTSKAKKLPGVIVVATGDDITDQPHGLIRAAGAPPWLKDKFALAKPKVRFVGDEVAAVAAIDLDTAEEAIRLIKVEYEELPAYLTIEEAMAEGAVRIHDHMVNNISLEAGFNYGDVEKAFSEADFIIEDHYETQYVCHAPLETHSVVADYSNRGEVTVWESTQTPFYDQTAIAETLGISVSKVRVIKPPVGGGFGGKTDALPPYTCAALLSKLARRPVKIIHTREEELIATSRRHPAYIDQKMGLTKDGMIIAMESIVTLDGGAYYSYGPVTINVVGGFQNGPYNIPNFRYMGKRVATNKPFCGAQRGHGAIQAKYALETLLEKAATEIGIDPVEIRIKNAIKPNTVTTGGYAIRSTGHVEAINKTQKAINWADKFGKMPLGKGIGIAANFFCSGAGLNFFYANEPSLSAVVLEGKEDGKFILKTGSSDLGQGSMTALAQIAAETIGINLDDIIVIDADTTITPIDMGSFSSRVTMFGGNASYNAALGVRKILMAIAAEEMEANPDDLVAQNGRIFVKGTPEMYMTHSEVINEYFAENIQPLIVKGYYNPPVNENTDHVDIDGVNLTPAFSFGAQTAEVDVDVETGIVKVKKIYAAHDCGTALNPQAVEGQIDGGISMSLGQAMTENFKMDKQYSITASFLDYKLPTSMDHPEIESTIVEARDINGPYGAKESGEGVNVPTIPAITNAIHDAVGIWIKELPITPEYVLKALKEKAGN